MELEHLKILNLQTKMPEEAKRTLSDLEGPHPKPLQAQSMDEPLLQFKIRGGLSVMLALKISFELYPLSKYHDYFTAHMSNE